MILRPWLVRLLPAALRVAAVLALVVVIARTGLGDAGDDLLRQQYYALRGERQTSQQVVLVAIDAPTVAAWGPAPLRGVQLDGLVAAIARGKPRVIGLVDEPARIAASVPAAMTNMTATLDLDDGAVRTVVLRTGQRVPVNYIGKRGLPMVSAIDVAAGKIPSDAFTGKIVVVGLTAQPHAGLVPTPIGPLASAQVQAHALSSQSDGVAWPPIPSWLRWLVIALICVLGVMFAHHLAMATAMLATAACGGVVLVIDYALFATGDMRFGATLPLLAVLAISGGERIFERVVLHRHVRDIAHWTRRWMLLESMRTDRPDDKPGYWRRVGEFARLYLGCTSSIIAELPAGRERLELRMLSGTRKDQLRERRLDVRRAPYRKAHLTLGPVWHDELMADGTRTLLVPLVVRNTTLIGFWMVNFENREAVTPSHMALIKTLAKEVAMAIDRRRSAAGAEDPTGVAGWLFGARRFAYELDEVHHAFQTHTQNQQDLLTLGESMPFGVFVATLWGDLRYANTVMKAVCVAEGIDPASTNPDFVGVIAALTGWRDREVHSHLRELVQGHRELHLHGRDRGAQTSFDVMLSWLKATTDDGEQLLVGCVLPRTVSNKQATLQVRPPPDEHAVTVLRSKVELDEFDADSASLAHGTPTFRTQERGSDPVLPIGLGSRVAPDATFKLRKATGTHAVADPDQEEITDVGDDSRLVLQIKFDS